MTPYVFTYSTLDIVFPLSALPLGLSDARLTLGPTATLLLAGGPLALYSVFIFLVWPTLYAPARALRLASRAPAPEPRWALPHHAALFAYSALACACAAWHVAAVDGASLTRIACAPVPAWLRLVSITFTASKVWEWLDTAVHFARGQSRGEIGFLHLYHHATTLLLFLCVMNFPGAEKSGMLLNGFVHTLMYYHYAFRLPRWARPLITGAQIAQLAAVTALWAATPGLCGGAPAALARDAPATFATPFLLVPVYLAFFLEFFFRSYCARPAKKEKQ